MVQEIVATSWLLRTISWLNLYAVCCQAGAIVCEKCFSVSGTICLLALTAMFWPACLLLSDTQFLSVSLFLCSISTHNTLCFFAILSARGFVSELYLCTMFFPYFLCHFYLFAHGLQYDSFFVPFILCV